MQKLLTPSCNYKSQRRGTALVGALVSVGIITMIVGIMLSSSNTAVRASRDKILFEEAYQAAVSGTHVARAWIIDPELGADMAGNGNIETELTAIVNAAKKMSEDVIESNYALADASPSQAKSTWFSNIGNATPLSDGRYVLYTFPQNAGRVASFENGKDNKQFNTSLFQGGSASDLKNYVDMVRITTPGTSDETTCSLRQTSLIIEARGVSEYAGTKKERVVQQRVLVYPNDTGIPLLKSNAAIITQAGLTIGGSSHINVHWGPVLAKEDLELLGMTLTKPTDPTLPWSLAPSYDTFKKYNGAGTYTYNLPDFTGTEVVDEWLSWETGVAGRLMADSGADPLFKDVALAPGQQITDFFAQLVNGDFAALNPGLTPTELHLDGKYELAGTSLDSPENYNGILTETEEAGTWQGALVQGDPAVDAAVDEFFAANNYAKLKAYAIDHNSYIRITAAGMVNAVGNPLWVDPATKQMSDVRQSNSWKRLTDLEQISMESLVPPDYDPLTNTTLDDRLLFVDSEGQSPDAPISGVVTINPKFFWKGIMYVNGSLDSGGAGDAPTVILRTPDEYLDESLPGHAVSSMLVEGILIVNGTVTSRGNMTIYGTLAGKGTIDLGGTPSIFYNPANGNGRIKDTDPEASLIRLIAGRLYEPETAFLP